MIVIYDSSIDMSFAFNSDGELCYAPLPVDKAFSEEDVEEWDVVDPVDAIDDDELAHAARIKSALKLAGGVQ